MQLKSHFIWVHSAFLLLFVAVGGTKVSILIIFDFDLPIATNHLMNFIVETKKILKNVELNDLWHNQKC